MTSQVIFSQKPAKPFIHPGLLQTRSDLELMKQKVNAGEQPWKDAFDRLSKSASLDFQPKPFTHIIRGPYGRPSIGGSELSSSAAAAYNHALMWYITGNKAHAQKAIEIINAWSRVLWDFDDNDAKVLAGWTGNIFCNAAEILRYTDSGWEKKDIEQFKRMLLTAYYPMIKNFFPEANGNWDAALINTMMCIGIFCDDHEIFDRTVNHFLIGNGNGGITKYIYPSGQCQENTRDMGHTQMGLGYFAEACQVAWTQGIDLYSTAGNRLALGFEFTAKYMLGEDVPVFGIISPIGRGRFNDIYEVVFQHYRYITGLDMPYTARAIENTRSRSSVGLLTKYKGPDNSSRTPSGAPQTSKFAPQSGALSASSLQPPSNSIKVAPGESIQSALDSAGKSGGWVVLGKGLHTLPAMLKISSGVTLAGQGIETILFLDPKLTSDRAGTAIINAGNDLHDVTLRDFVIESALTSKTASDPNQDRRQRSYQMAPSRAGIILSALKDGQMSNITFEHVTVRNSTHQGVAIKGAKQVKIIACDFSDNGSSVVPGQGLQHNLLLTHVEGCQIIDSRFDTSPWGNGIEMTYSSDISISNCEAARNSLNGIRSADCDNVRISGTLAEGNDGCGILFEPVVEGNRSIDVQDNLSHYNGQFGILIGHVREGTVRKNILTGNGLGDLVRLEMSEKIIQK
jgi:parallel beta-helix repeat protein